MLRCEWVKRIWKSNFSRSNNKQTGQWELLLLIREQCAMSEMWVCILFQMPTFNRSREWVRSRAHARPLTLLLLLSSSCRWCFFLSLDSTVRSEPTKYMLFNAFFHSFILILKTHKQVCTQFTRFGYSSPVMFIKSTSVTSAHFYYTKIWGSEKEKNETRIAISNIIIYIFRCCDNFIISFPFFSNFDLIAAAALLLLFAMRLNEQEMAFKRHRTMIIFVFGAEPERDF